MVRYIHDELVGGLLLLAATAAALAWANLAPGSYAGTWSTVLGPARLGLRLDLHACVNEGLMTVFFFVAGLEIKRELAVGELSRPRDAALPVLAALGGMAVPALVFAAFTAGRPGGHGWGTPMATDIAFVLGAVALLRSRAPAGLRLFLLAVAVADDLGAIVVLAVFYASGVRALWLLAAAATFGSILALRRIGAAHPVAYVVPGIALWLCLHTSGVHATVAGVLLGLATPARPVVGREILTRLEHRFHPVSALIVVPLFALANAGVEVRHDLVASTLGSRVAWGLAAGLVVGKPVGITLAVVLATRLGLGRLPAGVGPAQLVGGAALAGIGFTVSLLIAELSYGGTPTLAEAQLAVLAASIAAAAAGALILTLAGRAAPPIDGPADPGVNR